MQEMHTDTRLGLGLGKGSSHLPDLAERKIASITAMFLIEPSSETGSSLFCRMLAENFFYRDTCDTDYAPFHFRFHGCFRVC